MTLDIGLVLGILFVAIVLFVTGRVRVDVVSLMVLVTLALTGLLTPEQAVSGFSNSAVITVWAVLILSGGLARTGVAGMLGRLILRLAGQREWALIMVIMVIAASLSAFMSNVGVVALLLPVSMDISRRTGHAPSRLLIPLAFSSLLGGLMTLIGTPPNILVSAALGESGLEPFGMFAFVPVSAGVVVAGILYMSLIGRRFLPSRYPAREMAGAEVQLEEVYGLREGLFTLDVPAGSPLVGKSLADSRFGTGLDLQVLGVESKGRLALAPDPSTVFKTGDRIVVQGSQDVLAELGAREYLTLDDAEVVVEDLISDEAQFAEMTVAPGSRLIGKTLREIDFRHRFHGCLVLSLWRGERPIRTHLAPIELQPGDVLLVHGNRVQHERMGESPDFIVSTIFDPLVYELDDRLMSCTVPPDSPLVGVTLAESRLGDVFSLGVMGIVRSGVKQLIPPPEERLQAGDRLLVKGRPEDLLTAEGLHELPVEAETPSEIGELESEHVCLAELVLSPRSDAAGRTLRQLGFREKYGMRVLAVMRNGTVYRNLRHLRLEFGDALLAHGPREKLRLLATEPAFLVISEDVPAAPLSRKAPIAALVLIGVVGFVIAGLVPIHIAAVTGALVMVLTGCLTMDDAYHSIEWQAVFLIAGMLPLGLALQVTGAVELLTGGVVATVGGLGPLAVVASIFVLTAACAQVMPTAAAAILIAPLALHAATDLGLSPHALMMTVVLAASASFMSPFAHPSNVLVMGPGGYRFADYFRVGLPLTILCLLVTLLLLPIFWPLTL